MRILLIKTSSMGDILHTLPALTDAMENIENLRVDWVVEENFTQIPHWHPAVERVLPIALRRWRKNGFARDSREEITRFYSLLKAQNYDAVIDAQGLLKSALVTRLASGEKHGFDFKSARESLASLFYDRRYFVEKQQHAVIRTRELLSKSLGYSLPSEQGNYGIADHFLSALPQDAGQYLLFVHATTRDDKHWPEAHWRELIAQVKSLGLGIKLPWGTPLEKARAQRLASGWDHVEVLPFLSLTELAQLMMGARALVSVDTGLSHLAAALDRPNITLYGPTQPSLIGGYGRHQIALNAPLRDLTTLNAADVMPDLNRIINVI